MASNKIPGHLNASAPVRLTPQESKVLKLTYDGLTASEVADDIMVSRRTVEFHLANIHDKLGVNNTRKALARARELALL